MSYRDKKDIGPTQGEIALWNGPFGLAVIVIVLIVVGAAAFAEWAFS